MATAKVEAQAPVGAGHPDVDHQVEAGNMGGGAAEDHLDLRELEMELDDDDYAYEEVEIESDLDDDDDGETLEAVTRSLNTLNNTLRSAADAARADGEQDGAAGDGAEALEPGQVSRQPEVVDDFFRNFLVKMGLHRTLESFETEWYELSSTGKLNKENVGPVPDVYLHNQELDDICKDLRAELSQAKGIAHRATSTWDKLRKERDFHRMHHKRVAQEKNKLIQDIKRLRKHYSQYEPTVRELRHKYECAMKEKMLMRLERDRLQQQVFAARLAQEKRELAAQADAARSTRQPVDVAAAGGSSAPGSSSGVRRGGGGSSDAGTGDSRGGTAGSQSAAAAGPDGSSRRRPRKAVLPPSGRTNPYEKLEFDPVEISSWGMQRTFKGHQMSISSIAVHPEKPIFATASDDTTWKMWSYPDGDLMMCGEGHTDWVAGIDFHPYGTHLASASGDGTIKLWDFEEARCTATMSDHTQAVWDVAFHDMGDFVASASLDHSARLWDVIAQRTKVTFRGHVDSVNSIAWQPFSNNLCTASSDKTVSIWDARSGLCVQTFYGHVNSCNDVKFNLRGDTIVSVDSDGAVKLWDVRMVAEILSMNAGPYPANKCAIDRSGSVLAVASDAGSVMSFNVATGEPLCNLEGHSDAVQAVQFDPYGKYMISAGSDNTFRTWH